MGDFGYHRPSNNNGENSGTGDGTNVDLSSYVKKNNPVFQGSISIGRKADSDVGVNSTAMGEKAEASGKYSHAEGYSTKASADDSHAEGYYTIASGYDSHAEGYSTKASGVGSHAEGGSTTASADDSHAEGYCTIASGESSHAEGSETIASADYSHAEGWYSEATGEYSHAEGSSLASGEGSHSEGSGKAHGFYAHAEGVDTSSFGDGSHAEGWYPIAMGKGSHAEGVSSYAYNNVGITTKSSNEDILTAWNKKEFSLAKGEASHVEGINGLALGDYSHVEGEGNIASGTYSHAEGYDTEASGRTSHAEGFSTTASGNYSHSEGYETQAKSDYQHVQGKYNIEDTTDTYAHIVGNGLSEDARSNAHTLDWDGNAWFAGDVTIGADNKVLATEAYVDDAVADSPVLIAPVTSMTATGATVIVNDLTASGTYVLPKRTDGNSWSGLRFQVKTGDGKSLNAILEGYQHFPFVVNVETQTIYLDNLRIPYVIGDTVDTSSIKSEPYYLATKNTKEYTPTADYHPATKKYVDDEILPINNSVEYIKEMTGVSQFNVVNGILSNITTFATNKANGDSSTKRYINANVNITKAVYETNVMFVIKNNQGQYCNNFSFNVLPHSDLYNVDNQRCLWTINSVECCNGAKIQVKIYSGKQFDSNFALIDSAEGYCCIEITIASSATTEQITMLDTATFIIDIIDYNYLALDGELEYTPTRDYHPATKKYVDDTVAKIPNTPNTSNTSNILTTSSTVLANETIEFIGGNNHNYMSAIQEMPKENDKIIVTFDNVVYEYNATILEGYGIMIGNGNFYNSSLANNNEPICIIFIDYGDVYPEIYVDNAYSNGSYAIKIEKETMLIGEQYLPKLIGKKGSSTGEIFNNYKENIASGNYSHAEGNRTEASNNSSHAEGEGTLASGIASHAEGQYTEATSACCHAEGYNSIASSSYAHAEGYYTVASSLYTHAEGYYTKANGSCQHVQGKYNIEDTADKYAHIVGNGKNDTNRSNAHTLDWKGNAWYQGNVSVDGTPTNDNDLTTKKYVDDAVASVSASAVNAVSTEYVDGLLARIEALEKIVADLTNNNE